MSIIALFGTELPVVQRSLQFIRQAMRGDGSWPIDSNLSVWLTSSAMQALWHDTGLNDLTRKQLQSWLKARQFTTIHPFTHAVPGGWGWTHLPGSVPDADDTAGAMLALARCGGGDNSRQNAARWLLQLQNADGGWPTFCQGWGKLPFDQSSPDLTAHVLRALQSLSGNQRSIQRAISRGFAYLQRKQRADGSWIPLWFGNQAAPGQHNPVFGTARVLLAYAAYERDQYIVQQGLAYLLAAQHTDGGWGGDVGIAASVEETALAIISLAPWRNIAQVTAAHSAGIAYLLNRITEGSWRIPTPIGLYFASLWYTEELYPVIWTVEALSTALDAELKKGIDN